jgi:anti-sigma B factor antagonist
LQSVLSEYRIPEEGQVGARVFEVSRVHPLVGFRVAGELDLFSSSQLKLALADIDGKEPILIDLSELTFIDSAGIGEILALAGSRTDSEQVVLMNPSEPVRRALEIAGLDQHPAVEILVRASMRTQAAPMAIGVGQSATEAAA